MTLAETYSHISSNPIYAKLLGWSAMFLAMMSGASIGPMFKYLENHSIAPLMAASWRCQCMLIFLIPLAFVESKFNPTQWFEVKPGLKYPVIVYIIIAGVSWAGNLLSWISGLKYTSVVKASIIASLHPLLLVFVLRFSGEAISVMEWIGTVFSIIGMVISSGKGLYHMYHSENTDEEAVNARLELYGLCLCFLAAVSEVVVILNRVQIKKHVPLMQYTASTTFEVAVLSSLAAVFTQSNPFSHVICSENDCLYGWTSHEWVGKILLFAFIVGVMCIMGFNYAVVHISPLVFSSIQLLDPVLTGIMVWMAGLEGIPDLYTWIGGGVIMFGVGLITIGEYNRSHQKVNENSGTQLVEIKKISSIDDETVLLVDARDDDSTLSDECLEDLESLQTLPLITSSSPISLNEIVQEDPSSFIKLPSIWNDKTAKQQNLGHEYAVLSSIEEGA